MNRIVFCFVLLLSMVVSQWSGSGGQSDSPHFCAALRDNNNRIDYTLNFPRKEFYNNYIVIKGFFWKVNYKSSARRKRQDPPDDDSSEASDSVDQSSNSSSVTTEPPNVDGTGGTGVGLNDLYGLKFPNTRFFDEPFKCAFAIRFADVSDPDKWDTNLVGGLTEDYKKVKWANLPLAQNNETAPQNDPGDEDPNGGDDDDSNDRKKRQSNGTDPNEEDARVKEFETDFDSSLFRPQVAFSSMTNIMKTIFGFIETRRTAQDQGDLDSRFQGYEIPDPDQKWTNLTKPNIQAPFRRRRQSGNQVIPESVWNSAKKLYIKGVFPIKIDDSTPGSILLIETCSDIPCTQDVSYKYCVVPQLETNPVGDGKPCHPSNLKLLFDCTGDWGTTLPPNVPDDGPGPDGGPRPPGATDSDGKPIPSTTPASEGKAKSMGWLWILIAIIIIIIILIILCLLCCRGKGKEPQEAAPPPAAGASGAQASPSSVGSKASRSSGAKSTGSGAGVAKGSGGLSKSPSTLSTASTRSKTGSSGI